jgi:hypothetical protein
MCGNVTRAMSRWGDTPEMRIADEKGNPLDCVYLALTDAEAKELRDSLQQLVTTSEKGTLTCTTSAS